jgi:hypothetical protein
VTEDNDNPIIIRPHIAFTDEDNDNPIIIPPNIVLTDEENNDNPIIYDWVVVVVFRQ